jgi:hypothetical protein
MWRYSKRLGQEVWVDTPKRKPVLNANEQKNMAHLKYIGCNTGGVKYYSRLARRIDEVCNRVDRVCSKRGDGDGK